MKQKNINFLIGGRFYYTMRYVFPLVKYLVLFCIFENRWQHMYLCPKITIFCKDLLNTYKIYSK